MELGARKRPAGKGVGGLVLEEEAWRRRDWSWREERENVLRGRRPDGDAIAIVWWMCTVTMLCCLGWEGLSVVVRLRRFGGALVGKSRDMAFPTICPLVYTSSTSTSPSRNTPPTMSASAAKKGAINLIDPAQTAGLQSLLSRLYGKPVQLELTKLRRAHLDADILAAAVTQRLRDRKNQPRRVIRDAAWKAQLPSDRAVVELQQAKKQPGVAVTSRAVERASAFGPLRTPTSNILRSLKLSQVSSVAVGAAGRLTKRITANRSQRKVARRGANAKGAGYMVRGFRKSHVKVALRHGKRRIGSYGIRVKVGHT